ncbi:MAG: hypothetical protein JKX84_04365 [Flavobacteriales bacterium]|nr:hypothetical protein [Flavobacteriales bacterium]
MTLTVHYHEYWINEPVGKLQAQIRSKTQIVAFKAFYFFNSNHEDYKMKWLGEIKTSPYSFTLFRITSPTRTSDFRVSGRLDYRNGRPVLTTKIKLHYSALLGFVGLLLFTVSISLLLSEKFPNYNPLFFFIPSIAIVFCYGFFQLNDFRKTRQLLDELVLSSNTARL